MTTHPFNPEQLSSPHCDAREGDDISLLVIHNISLPAGEWGTPHVKALFMGTLDTSAHPSFEVLSGLKVSAHLFIDRQGHILQFVPFEKRAWHAGESSFEGRTCCNDFSIGIELEGSDTTPFTDAQYDALVKATKVIQAGYPKITKERIVGHSDIAPSRKTDPGPLFDWDRFFRLL
ncbi:MAG: 1,6-anhydro-N-acetylmuramyl-L-alanine amidase AmpD [Gammaproteobacteria bacterium]